MKELLISLVSGIIGGIIVVFVQKYLDRKEKLTENKRNLIIDPSKNKKIIPSNILSHLEPGLSIEKTREILGVPDTIYSYCGEEDNSQESQAYVYGFQNASIKITSSDKISINSITIFCDELEEPKIEIFPNFFDDGNKGLLGKSKIDSQILEYQTSVHNVSSMRERMFILKAYFGRYGGYLDYAYAGTDFKNYEEFVKTANIELLKGEIIYGYTVSNSSYIPEI